MAIIDLIQLPNQYPDEVVRRVPESGSGEFRLGSQLVVREDQRAVFMRDGKALDVFGPGRHTISTNNIPFLSRFGQGMIPSETTILQDGDMLYIAATNEDVPRIEGLLAEPPVRI